MGSCRTQCRGAGGTGWRGSLSSAAVRIGWEERGRVHGAAKEPGERDDCWGTGENQEEGS